MRPSNTSGTALPQPGELFVALDADGRWCRALSFVGFADARSDRWIFALPGEPGETVLLSPSEVMRPRVADHRAVPPSGTVAPDRPARPALPRGNKITPAQRRALFAESRRLGMDLDELRAAVPGGSISRLTRAQAADVLDRLRGRAASGCATLEQCHQLVASPSQRQYAADLAAACGLEKRDFARWLVQRFDVDNVACLSRSQANGAIKALLQMRSKCGELDARRLRKRSFA